MALATGFYTSLHHVLKVLGKHATFYSSLHTAFCQAASSQNIILQGVHVHPQVNDGSTLSGLQVVVQPEVPGYDLLENGSINTGAAVRVQGQLVESPGRNQKVCTAQASVQDVP